MAKPLTLGSEKKFSPGGEISMVRCFVALELSEHVKSFVATVVSALKRVTNEARWVNPQGMHLTLKFLGDVPATTIPTVVRSLEKPLMIPGPIELGIGGLGCFPNMKRPRVLWIGVIDKQSRLQALVQEIGNAMLPLGFPQEKRSFKPHLTLARMKPSRERSTGITLITESQNLAGPIFSVDHAVLFESILKPQGALYHPIKRFDFL